MLTTTVLFKANVKDTCIYTEKKKKKVPQFFLNLNKKEPLPTARQKWQKKINCTEYAALNYMQKSVNWKIAEKTKNPTTSLQSFIHFIYKAFQTFFQVCCRDHANLVLEKQASAIRSVTEEPPSPGLQPAWGQGGLRQDFYTSPSYKNNEAVPEKHTMEDDLMKVQRNLLVESSVLLLPGALAPRYVCAWKAFFFLKLQF